jgi:transposase
MAYSLDFRRRVFALKKLEALTFSQTAERFKVGISTLVRWSNRLEPILKRNKPATKIDMEALRKDVEQHPDAFFYERAKRLGASKSGIEWALKRLGVVRKKKPQASQGGPRQTVYVLPKT